MIATVSLCWIGTGLWLLSDPRRAQRVWPPGLGATPPWLLRALGVLLLLASAVPLVRQAGGPLAGVVALVALMVALSAAVLLFPLRPRWYAASVAVAGVTALSSALLG